MEKVYVVTVGGEPYRIYRSREAAEMLAEAVGGDIEEMPVQDKPPTVEELIRERRISEQYYEEWGW